MDTSPFSRAFEGAFHPDLGGRSNVRGLVLEDVSEGVDGNSGQFRQQALAHIGGFVGYEPFNRCPDFLLGHHRAP